MIPVIDIFAGPGGLAEGFSSLHSEGERLFDIRLSVEKESVPYETLRLRTFFRQFPTGEVPEDYYGFLRGQIGLDELYKLWPEQSKRAEEGTWQAAIGKCPQDELDRRISSAIGSRKDWVLTGGPPC